MLLLVTPAGEMKAVAAGALGIGCVIFLVLALGSIAAFGPALNSNILNNMSATGMAPLIGSGPAAVSAVCGGGGGGGAGGHGGLGAKGAHPRGGGGGGGWVGWGGEGAGVLWNSRELQRPWLWCVNAL